MKKAHENVANGHVVISSFKCIVNIVLTLVPILWFSIFLPFFGFRLNFVNSDNEFTSLGKILTSAVIVIVLVSIIIYNVLTNKETRIEKKDYKKILDAQDKIQEQNDILSGKMKILKELQNTNDDLCDNKLTTLTEEITNVLSNKTQPSRIISNPRRQLEIILRNIKKCIYAITLLDFNAIHVVGAYRINNRKWEWVKNFSAASFKTPDLLIHNKSSTFYQLLRQDDKRKHFIFYNKKSDAYKKECYVKNNKDIYSTDGKDEFVDGSIIAYYECIEENAVPWVEFAIFLTTTNNEFIVEDGNSADIKNANKILEKRIFGYYQKRIQIELCLLFLDYLYKKSLGKKLANNENKLKYRVSKDEDNYDPPLVTLK